MILDPRLYLEGVGGVMVGAWGHVRDITNKRIAVAGILACTMFWEDAAQAVPTTASPARVADARYLPLISPLSPLLCVSLGSEAGVRESRYSSGEFSSGSSP